VIESFTGYLVPHRDVNKDLTPKDKDLTPKDQDKDLLDLTPRTRTGT